MIRPRRFSLTPANPAKAQPAAFFWRPHSQPHTIRPTANFPWNLDDTSGIDESQRVWHRIIQRVIALKTLDPIFV